VRRNRVLPTVLTALAVLLTLTGRLAPAAVAAGAPAFGFESGADGFTAPGWLAANAGSPYQDTTQASEETHSLALPVRFTGGSWDQAGVSRRLDGAPVDVSGYRAVTFAVYAPTAGLVGDLVFNDPWRPAAATRRLRPGWNTLTFDLGPSSQDFPGGVTAVNEIVLRVVGQNVTFQGTVWFDDVRFVTGTAPSVVLRAPRPDDTLTTAQGRPYAISAQVAASSGRHITSVTWRSKRQSGTLRQDGDHWVSDWDLWREGDGIADLTVTATDSTGDHTTATARVWVHDSRLAVAVVSPAFDATSRGRVPVRAAITPDSRFHLRRVRLTAGRVSHPMRLGPPDAAGRRIATAALDTRALHDGATTFRVTATDAAFSVTGTQNVMVVNHPAPWGTVGTRGTRFTTDGRSFRYAGANEYELFTRTDQATLHLDHTSDGTIVPAGTVRPWREQIDRQLLEMSRQGMTVLRTWAFDDDPDAFAFQPGPGEYNEAAFAKLDYIVDSARRHGIRVILTMTNYWSDYGGIGAYAGWLGLPNKLEFFTDPRARALYEKYVAHLVDRVNTVSGIRYKDDPTVFAWELMNEPRMDCADDPTPDKRYCDASGRTLRDWIAREAAYVKRLDPRHMVSAGGEGHGLVRTGPGTAYQWARTDEGGGDDPYFSQDVPGVDLLTFHPYPNASWADMTGAQTRDLVRGLTRMGVARGKPVVMSEYGIFRSQPVRIDADTVLKPGDAGYAGERLHRYDVMLRECYAGGCAGSNVWMVADWSDSDLNVNLYFPGDDAARDAALVRLLHHWAVAVG
jgi:Cellulase (glycosyl hydrolase family 5)